MAGPENNVDKQVAGLAGQHVDQLADQRTSTRQSASVRGGRSLARDFRVAVIITTLMSVVALSTIGWILTNHLKDDELVEYTASTLIEVDLTLIGLIKDMRLHVVQVQQWLTDISATRALDGLDDGFIEAEVHAEAFKVAADKVVALARSQKMEDIERDTRSALDAFPAYYASGIRMANAYVADGPASGNKIMADFDEAAATQTRTLDELSELIHRRTENQRLAAQGASESSNASVEFIKLVGIFVVVVGIAVLVLASYYMQTRIITPLVALTAVTQAYAAKQYDKDVVHADRGNEIGALARALDTLRGTASEADDLYRQQQDSLELIEESRQKQVQADKEILEGHQQAAEAARLNGEHEQRQAEELRHKVDLLLDAVDAAIAGELSVEVGVQGEDAIGKLGNGLDRLLKAFQANMHKIHDSAVGLSSSSERLNALSSKLSDNAKRTSEQSGQTSATAQEVSDNVDSVASASSEMSMSISEISNKSTLASQVVEKAVDLTLSTDRSVRELSSASASIGDVTKVIASIADQTNLLALNATIEAARAGEAGKGFAVVASEVKELANETGKATQEIEKRIASIQDNTDLAATAVREIIDVIKQISEIQSSIRVAIDEQTTTTKEINRLVVDAAGGSAEIARGISDVADGALSSLGNVDEARVAANDLSTITDGLNKLVAYYR